MREQRSGAAPRTSPCPTRRRGGGRARCFDSCVFVLRAWSFAVIVSRSPMRRIVTRMAPTRVLASPNRPAAHMSATAPRYDMMTRVGLQSKCIREKVT